MSSRKRARLPFLRIMRWVVRLLCDCLPPGNTPIVSILLIVHWALCAAFASRILSSDIEIYFGGVLSVRRAQGFTTGPPTKCCVTSQLPGLSGSGRWRLKLTSLSGVLKLNGYFPNVSSISFFRSSLLPLLIVLMFCLLGCGLVARTKQRTVRIYPNTLM